ncbi:hypothetical protein SEA_MOAB_187 [Streptomyces phage Moab]|nr:hypothetical protein SEA_MOAB_187 [Streptomyces phage Moab]WMI33794.1 hypothetical protein SEA_PATELGO_189 [Streptomyces phage Patelgo]
MFYVGMRVRVKDNYAGGLDNVVGRTGKVLRTNGESYLLDIQGSRKASWGDYTYERDVIVTDSEIESVSFDLKDSKGRKIELGDKVAYGPLGGGVTVGTVIDIDERGEGWSKAVKFRLEIDVPRTFTDGGDRTLDGGTEKSYRWYQYGGRALILSKNPINDNVFKINIPTY